MFQSGFQYRLYLEKFIGRPMIAWKNVNSIFAAVKVGCLIGFISVNSWNKLKCDKENILDFHYFDFYVLPSI